MSENRKSELVAALEKRAAERPIEFIDAAEFCSPLSPLAGKKIGLRVALKAEEMTALESAEKQLRKAGGDSPLTDRSYVIDNRTLHILWQVTRCGDSEDLAKAFPAFDSPQHMSGLLSGDECAALLNKYNAIALKHSPSETKIDTATVDDYEDQLASASDEVAAFVLSRCDRVWLEQFCRVMCARRRDDKALIAALRAEIEGAGPQMQFVPVDVEGDAPQTLAGEAGVK